jgi:hypothetical protein
VSAGGRSFLARVARTGEGATAARLAWAGAAPPRVRARARLLFLVWCPVPLAALMFLILIVNARRRNGGSREDTDSNEGLVAAFAAVLIARARAAWAAESSEVEELRREVRSCRPGSGLRQAISEAAEFDRQRPRC